MLMEAGCEQAAEAGPSFTGLHTATFVPEDPALHRLRDLLQRGGYRWSERPGLEYTEAELRSAPLLLMVVGGSPLGIGGPEAGTEFDLSGACPQCGSNAIQTGPLLISAYQDLPATGDLLLTLTREVLFSEAIATALQRENVTGLELMEVRSALDGSRLPWSQAVSRHELPAMAAGTQGLIKSEPCSTCGRDGHFGDPHRPLVPFYALTDKDLQAVPDVAHTYERFGRSRRGPTLRECLFAQPLLAIRPRIYELLAPYRVPGLEFRPVHLVG